ncbi:MAG: mannosyltransferase [Akkermansiaceae bacterium]|jgi:mannosyltransferase
MDVPRLILGNSNKRFSGVTSTMRQTLPAVQKRMPLVVLGKHHLDEDTPVITFREVIALRDQTRIFHARRNDEMMQALTARKLGARLKIIFTSTAQRHHSHFTRWLMSQMDGIVTTCSAANSYLRRPADIIIPHGIDLARYQPPSDKKRAWQALGFPGDYGIGIFGRVRPSKGIDLLVEAAIPLLKKDPAPSIIIVGETTPKFRDYQKQLQAKIEVAGLSKRIIFHGKRPQSELPGLFQGMSLVAALSRNEGFGLTVLEAMASGCAVLASHAGAWQDIITEDLHGLAVPCGDLPATQRALERLLCSTDLAGMGIAGRQEVEEHYTIQREAAALVDFYQETLSRT